MTQFQNISPMVKALPKVELHRHLEGALRFSTVVELAKKKGLQLPFHNPTALKNSLLVTEPMRDLKSVLEKFFTTQSLLDSPEVLERITYENIEDAYNEGIRVLELRYSLSFIHKNHENMTYEQIHSAILKGMERAKKSFPVAVGLIGIVGRIDPPRVQNRVADFMVESAKTWIGIDLADNESDVDTLTLVPIFQKAKAAGLHVTVHAGEAPGTHNNVKEAVLKLGAERIGHGVQIYQHPELIDFVKQNNIVLELCPYSNYLTNQFSSTKAHPFRMLMESGVQVTLNSDDPGIFDSSLSFDYEILRQEHGFTQEELRLCNKTALKATFIKNIEKSVASAITGH